MRLTWVRVPVSGFGLEKRPSLTRPRSVVDTLDYIVSRSRRTVGRLGSKTRDFYGGGGSGGVKGPDYR